MKHTIAKNLKEQVARNLIRYRKEKKLKQKQVAKQIFVSVQAYQSYEYKRTMPGIDVLIRLQEFYSLTSIECFYK